MSTAFETEMGVLPEIAKAVDEMEWTLPTDIQSDAIPLILGGGDVLMAAETGSGKTGAFCLPVLQIVYESLKNCDEKKLTSTDKSWKMNVYDRTSSMAIDSDGTLCQSRDTAGWHGCRANKAVKRPGRYYFETLATDDGLCRVGWSTKNATLELGTCPHGFGFGGTGKKSNNKKFDSYGSSFGNGDKIGNCIDFEKNEIRWYKNGVDLGVAYKIPVSMSRDEFYPSVCLKNAEMRFDFGKTGLASVPEGYTVLEKAPRECVVASSCGSGTTNGSSTETTTKRGPLAVIIEPSRELAEQTYKQLGLFNKYLRDPQPIVSLIVGGANTRDQQIELQHGVDIVVATPGRLQDLIAGGALSLDNCRFFVLDECDGLLSQGHKALIEEVHRNLPKIGPTGERLQMIVCSATLHSFEVKKLANSMMHFPQWVDLKGEDSVPDTVHHVVCVVDPKRRGGEVEEEEVMKMKMGDCLTDGVHSRDQLSRSVESPELLSQAVKIIKLKCVVDVIEKLNIDRALIFCRTKLDCDNLEKLFVTHGGGPKSNKHKFSCVCLHGDRKPDERKKNLDRFKREEVRFMICTDVAARGIDIKGLPYVINVTLPDEKENYVHRIGRVGRAERMGLAISLVSSVKEKVWYHANCNNRGQNCHNTNLVEQKGCCIWYDEKKILTDIEEHLGVTIDQIGRDFKIQVDEFDGKVVYGEKMKKTVTINSGHVDILAPTVRELAALEKECQQNYFNLLFNDIRMLH